MAKEKVKLEETNLNKDGFEKGKILTEKEYIEYLAKQRKAKK